MIEVHIRHGQASAETAWGLTIEGKIQAKAAAIYLESNFPKGFDIGIHSGSRRAVETAQLLGLSNIDWVTDERLREADWNGMPEPRELEVWKEMYDRVGAACNDLDARNRSVNRIIVSHGGTMHMIRAYREGFIGSRFPLLFEEPYKYFTNCQMIIYTNENPRSQTIESGRLWVKSVCPWSEGHFGHDWMEVNKR